MRSELSADEVMPVTAGDLPLEELAARCKAEILRFRRGEPYDDSFCLELFRRAIIDGSGDAWRELQLLYRTQVIAWCRSAVAGLPLEPEDLAALAWEKFWASYTATKFEQAKGTPAIQHYLKLCAKSASIDAVREQQKGTISLDRPLADGDESHANLGDTVPDDTPTPEEEFVDEATRRSFWAYVDQHSNTEEEKVVIRLQFEMSLSSAEVQVHRPDLFPTVNHVYRTTRNLLDRLRRSPEMKRWLDNNRQ